jgi:hypothetical protein
MRNWERWDYVLSPLLSQNPKLLRRENSLPFFLRFLDRARCRCRHGDNSTAESTLGVKNGNGRWSEGELGVGEKIRVRTKEMNWGNGFGVERRKWCCGSKDIEARHLHLVLLYVCVTLTQPKISQLFIYFNQLSLFMFIFLK